MQESTAEQLDVIEAAFHAALEQAEADRSDWIKQQLRSQPQLVPSVMRLLQAHVHGEGIELTACQPATGGDSQHLPNELEPGTRIGAWRIERLLARGGMSRVYLVHRQLAGSHQQAALKLIATDADERRFDAERSILARLEHPAIARLIDGGLDPERRPWLATEYVDGEAIDQYCQTHRASPRQILDLLIELADALAHAHANLIVHRDIKPGNVLVTADSHVKLLDFGIATLLQSDATRATRTGTSVMTPHYAAPEQILGRPVTAQTDVHALGVLAYELFSGQHPYQRDGMPIVAITHAIVDTQAPRPSAVGKFGARNKRLRGDIDAIVHKAMRKDPAQRYASASSLAEDLSRARRGESVQARRGNRWYRLRRGLYRHRLVVTTSAAVLVLLVTALGMRFQQISAERDQAATFANFMDGLITDLDPVERNVEDANHLRVEDVLDAGMARLRSSQMEPAVRARLLVSLARDYNSLFASKKAEQAAREALQLAHTHAIPQSTQWDAGIRLADALTQQHDYSEAESVLKKLQARSTDDRHRHGLTSRHYGLMLREAGRLPEAVQQLDIARKELANASDTSALVKTLRELAMAHDNLGQRPEALDAATEAWDVNRTQLPGNRVRLARSEELYAQYLAYSKPKLAETHMKHALDELRRFMGEASTDVTATENNYALILWNLKRYDDAEAMLRSSLEHKGTQPGVNQRELAMSWQNLAALLCDIGRYQRCIKAARRARDGFDDSLPSTHYERAFPRLTIAGAELATGHPDKARKALLVARPLLRAALPESNSARLICDARLAMVDAATGHCANALPRLHEIFAHLKASDRVRFRKEFTQPYLQCHQTIPDMMTTSSAVSNAASSAPG